MTIKEVASFLDCHPTWSPTFAINVKGKYIMDGFLDTEGRWVSTETVKCIFMLAHNKDT